MINTTITYTLNHLSNKELDLCEKAEELCITPNSFNNQFILNNIYAQYQSIHIAYTELAHTSIEALKRALFIQWYAVTEPSYLTGIANLNKTAIQQTITLLEKQIKTTSDKELQYMLNYYLLWDYVFISIKKSDINEVVIPTINTKNRGQMGMYWKSILTQKTKR